MTAQATIPPRLFEKTEPKQPAPAPVEPPKPVPVSKPRVYWGDRWTLVFWLCCFAIMAGMNLVEGIRSLILYLIGNTGSP